MTYQHDCHTCRMLCGVCSSRTSTAVCAHPMRIEGNVLRCRHGHEAERDPVAEMRAAGARELL